MYLDKRGGFWIKIHGSVFQMAGIPDLIGCYRGRFIGFEVKRPGLGATLIQQYVMGRITAAGGVTAVIHSIEEAVPYLDRIDEDSEAKPS